MDFQKLKSLVDSRAVVDIEKADEHTVRVSYKYGDDTAWLEYTPEIYKSEEELVAVINTDIERRLHGKIKTSLG